MNGAMTPRTKAIVDRGSVALFGLAFAYALYALAPGLASVDLVTAAPVALLLAYLLADFLAGTVHWLADRYFDPQTPFLGPMLIAPFREHHVDPASIGRHDFFEVTGNNALVSTPVVVAVAQLPQPEDWAGRFLALFGLGLALWLVATNLFHGWAHADRPPAMARRLQDWGVILSPTRHARHHRDAHDRAYCVTSGWLNPLLDRTRFFARLEQILRDRARSAR